MLIWYKCCMAAVLKGVTTVHVVFTCSAVRRLHTPPQHPHIQLIQRSDERGDRCVVLTYQPIQRTSTSLPISILSLRGLSPYRSTSVHFTRRLPETRCCAAVHTTPHRELSLRIESKSSVLQYSQPSVCHTHILSRSTLTSMQASVLPLPPSFAVFHATDHVNLIAAHLRTNEVFKASALRRASHPLFDSEAVWHCRRRNSDQQPHIIAARTTVVRSSKQRYVDLFWCCEHQHNQCCRLLPPSYSRHVYHRRPQFSAVPSIFPPPSAPPAALSSLAAHYAGCSARRVPPTTSPALLGSIKLCTTSAGHNRGGANSGRGGGVAQ